MGANKDVNGPIGKPHQSCLTQAAFFATRKNRNVDGQARKCFLKAGIMLPRKDFCRREHRRLHPCLNAAQQRHQRDHRLSSAHIALQQAQHWPRLRKIAFNLGNGALLSACERERQL